ncbi:hypothetical protein [Brachybacterium sp. GPGPB12]|uniref:protein kinase domain-containing protein n=1 Tax=Brachybacterium sp. GPGPB12 TaxID=3023517 RepID=UPI0031345BA7
MARPLAAAVAAVHRAQLVHRDLSPGNLLLTSTSGESARAVGVESSPSAVVRADERLLVADLGMCKDLARGSGLTVAAGTDGFRPPEQSRPGTVDIRADIWAMSASLRWLIDDAEMPQALQDVLTRGLSEDPDARQAEATEWIAEVEESLAPPRPRNRRAAPLPASRRRPGRRRRRLAGSRWRFGGPLQRGRRDHHAHDGLSGHARPHRLRRESPHQRPSPPRPPRRASGARARRRPRGREPARAGRVRPVGRRRLLPRDRRPGRDPRGRAGGVHRRGAGRRLVGVDAAHRRASRRRAKQATLTASGPGRAELVLARPHPGGAGARGTARGEGPRVTARRIGRDPMQPIRSGRRPTP